MRVDFGISWRWQLVAHPYYFPIPPIQFMEDGGRYEFYSSVPPGGSGFNASWIVPPKTNTLTADSKETDPNPLQLLLATKVGEGLRLWWRGTVSDPRVNGQSPYGGWLLTGWPGDIYWSCAVVLPRLPDLGPVVPPTEFDL